MIDDKQRRPSGAPSGQFCLGGREYRLGPAAERGAVTAWPAAEAGGGVWDDVLIRRLRPGAGERQVRLFRLAWEAEAEQLDLPGARSLFFEQPESGCILRSFPKAPSLAALFEQRPGPLPAEEALELTARLLRALEGFHSRGLLHLDIRAEQIYPLPGRRLFLDNCPRPGHGAPGGGRPAALRSDTAPRQAAPYEPPRWIALRIFSAAAPCSTHAARPPADGRRADGDRPRARAETVACPGAGNFPTRVPMTGATALARRICPAPLFPRASCWGSSPGSAAGSKRMPDARGRRACWAGGWQAA
ncbi:MAG: hypothetical protein ACLUEK_09835 [Oscillospiraceae bacterium]